MGELGGVPASRGPRGETPEFVSQGLFHPPHSIPEDSFATHAPASAQRCRKLAELWALGLAFKTQMKRANKMEYKPQPELPEMKGITLLFVSCYDQKIQGDLGLSPSCDTCNLFADYKTSYAWFPHLWAGDNSIWFMECDKMRHKASWEVVNPRSLPTSFEDLGK